jgi:hypothetical protein
MPDLDDVGVSEPLVALADGGQGKTDVRRGRLGCGLVGGPV